MSRRIFAIVFSIVATVAAFFLAKAAGADLLVPAELGGDMTNTQEMPVAAVVIFTAAMGLLAWGLAVVLERFTSRARLIWLIIALVVVIGSFASMFQLGIGGTDAVWQGSLHLVFAAILITGFWGTFRTPPVLEG